MWQLPLGTICTLYLSVHNNIINTNRKCCWLAHLRAAPALFCSAFLCSILRFSTLHCFAQLCVPQLGFALLCVDLLCPSRLGPALL